MEPTADYDPRYLAGIVLFNRGDFFEAHEVWEDLWMDTASPDKRFYQGLIQAAVGLLHFCNGNVRGALKLYKSGRDYMFRTGSPHQGLDVEKMWQQMQLCFQELLDTPDPDKRIEPKSELLPTLDLHPPPLSWPDPAEFLPPEEEHPR